MCDVLIPCLRVSGGWSYVQHLVAGSTSLWLRSFRPVTSDSLEVAGCSCSPSNMDTVKMATSDVTAHDAKNRRDSTEIGQEQRAYSSTAAYFRLSIKTS